MKTNKQHLLSLIAAAALLAACTAVDETDNPMADSQTAEPTAINFNAYVNRGTTRSGTAGVLTTNALKTGGTHAADGFGVFGYYTDNAPYTSSALPNFMYNQQVTYSADQWTYSPVKYWPNETGETAQSFGIDNLSFFAYAPYVPVADANLGFTADTSKGITSLVRANENGYPYVRYAVSTKPSESVDLCYATKVLNQTKPAVNTKVDFDFNHALAALNVQIDADVNITAHTGDPLESPNPLDTYTRIFVRSITFTGFATKGQLNLYTGAWNNLECDCDVTSAPITIHDGRWDGYEGLAASPNERPVGLNPAIVQWCSYDDLALTDGGWTTKISSLTEETWSAKYAPSSLGSDRPSGVTNTPVNLFDVSDWTFANPASPTVEELKDQREAPIYVIPTTVPIRVTIVYDVETCDPKLVSNYLGDGVTNGSTVENNITATTAITMTAGKKYTLNLHLGMASVQVEAEVNPWPDTEADAIDLPKNN